MTAKKPVKVFWYPADDHGRKAPPIGPKYFAVFRADSNVLSNENWSVVLDRFSPTDRAYCWTAMLSFVSNDAPFSSLQPGNTFHLFEGRWPVAEGVVLQPAEAQG